MPPPYPQHCPHCWQRVDVTFPELRDRFAMAALEGLLASHDRGNSSRIFDESVVADDAFAIADAMMKRRDLVEPRPVPP